MNQFPSVSKVFQVSASEDLIMEKLYEPAESSQLCADLGAKPHMLLGA